MGRKIDDDKPVFGPERPPKKTNSSNLNNSSLKKLALYISKDTFCLKGFMKLMEKEIQKAGGVKQFLENNKEFAPALKKIAQRSGNEVAKWAPKEFPELGLTEKDLKESYKNQLKIYDKIISSNNDNSSEKESSIIGEGGNDQVE